MTDVVSPVQPDPYGDGSDDEDELDDEDEDGYALEDVRSDVEIDPADLQDDSEDGEG